MRMRKSIISGTEKKRVKVPLSKTRELPTFQERPFTATDMETLWGRLEGIGFTDVETNPYGDVNYGVIRVTYKGRIFTIGYVLDLLQLTDTEIKEIIKDELKDLREFAKEIDVLPVVSPKRKPVIRSTPLPRLTDQQPIILGGPTSLRKLKRN